MNRIIHCFITISLAMGIFALTSPAVMAGQKCDPAKRDTTPDARYVVRGNDIYDTTTRLTWQRCTMGRHWQEGRGCAGTTLPMNWGTAMRQAGNGWRLPSKEELETLVSTCCVKPAINRNIFPDVGVDGPWWYWTSTPFTKDAAGAWAVHFGDGGSGYNFPHKKGAVRLVRSGDVSGSEKVSRYDETARGINAPMYEYYAKKIKEKTNITKGFCLDVGSGGGYLGLALAKITDLDFIFLDISPAALERAKQHIVEDGLQKRAKTLLADVQNIPLADGSVNLVISRGSIPFWKDPAKGLREIYRVLAPGGKAYVGGGRGTPEIQARIAAKRMELERGSRAGQRKGHKGFPKIPQRNYEEIVKTAGIKYYVIHKGDDGMWIQMWKE